MRMLTVALLVVLAGCGSGSEPARSTPPAKATQATPSATRSAPTTPAVAPTRGTPMPEALSKFRCERDAKGVWSTSGFVSNPGKSSLTFQITVHVGDATGGEDKAKTRQVPGVAAGGSARFEITKLPGPDTDDAPCHVQVLAGR